MIKDPISDKEKKLVENLKKLNPKELEAYRYFIKEDQLQIADEASDHMFDLFCTGKNCDEIRKIVKSYSYGQIVACRVIGDWDNRKEARRLATRTDVPEQAPITLLEAADFLGDLILATKKRFSAKLKQYNATGDESLLEGLPMARNVKELQTVVELFMKASGQDSEKVVKHTGTVDVNHQVAAPVAKPVEEDNEATLDELLGINIVDTEFEAVEPKQLTDGK